MVQQELHMAPRPRVLVTGASGFLGGYAVREFASHGYDVVATGRNQAALEALQSEHVTAYPSNLQQLETADVPVDVVVHAAALSSTWGKWQDFYDNNVAGTESVIRFAEHNAVRRLVHVSSPSIYTGRGDRYNVSETDYDATNRLNYYIRSKLLAEAALQAAHQAGRLPELVIVRPRGLVGVGDPSMIPRLMAANQKIGIPLFNDGENLVDLTCVENAATALRLAAEVPRANGQAYNITNGEPRTFRSILDEFFEHAGTAPRYIHPNVRVMYALGRVLETVCAALPGSPEPPLTRYTVSTLGYSQTLDISRATMELGYKPALSLSEGIRRQAETYRSAM